MAKDERYGEGDLKDVHDPTPKCVGCNKRHLGSVGELVKCLERTVSALRERQKNQADLTPEGWQKLLQSASTLFACRHEFNRVMFGSSGATDRVCMSCGAIYAGGVWKAPTLTADLRKLYYDIG